MKENPLSIYIHFPWCEVKCPYCDFNSYVIKHKKIHIDDYVDRMIQEIEDRKRYYPQRQIASVFLGGGTPSLMTASQINRLLDHILKIYQPTVAFEVTIEMNPESVTNDLINELGASYVNRISLGVQSFCNKHLITLGRIHNSDKAKQSLEIICKHFENVNIDLMYGLPKQSLKEAIIDLNTAFQYPIKHLSWYQLTIEPKTAYFKNVPKGIPFENDIIQIEKEGKALINKNDFFQYEISAYANNNNLCLHNLNYWLFGDYMGIGAGAHSKYSNHEKQFRIWNHNKPDSYMNYDFRESEPIKNQDIIFEYFLNRLRLNKLITNEELKSATSFEFDHIESNLNRLFEKGLMTPNDGGWEMTDLGLNFYNDVVSSFINDDKR